MPRKEVDVLILGAGVAGLACRFALSGRRETVCVEASEEIGGLLRMFHHGGYSFDSTVHALPSRGAMAGTLLGTLAGTDLRCFDRRSLVWQRGRVIEYPYQFNAHALPPSVRDECLAELPPRAPARGAADWVSFEDWLVDQFGRGFYRHFFEPYNRKLYGVDPSRLEAAPMTWTIPADNREAVLRGGEGPQDAPRAELTYPSGRMGIAVLPARLAERGSGEILLRERVVRIDLDAHEVVTESGLELHYEVLVSTLPLRSLLGCATGLPQDVRRWAGLLSARCVTIVQIAIERSGPGLPAPWSYFPDPEVPFYRLTRLERISPDLAPEGGSAVLLECAGDPVPSDEDLLRICRELQVVGPGDARCTGRLVIPHAYVLFERGHRAACAQVIEHLAGKHVRVAGRYGLWGYFNIGQTIESGVRAGLELLAA